MCIRYSWNFLKGHGRLSYHKRKLTSFDVVPTATQLFFIDVSLPLFLVSVSLLFICCSPSTFLLFDGYLVFRFAAAA